MRSNPTAHNREREFDFRPAVYSFADECTAVAGRMLAYMGCLALLAMAAVALCGLRAMSMALALAGLCSGRSRECEGRQADDEKCLFHNAFLSSAERVNGV